MLDYQDAFQTAEPVFQRTSFSSGSLAAGSSKRQSLPDHLLGESSGSKLRADKGMHSSPSASSFLGAPWLTASARVPSSNSNLDRGEEGDSLKSSSKSMSGSSLRRSRDTSGSSRIVPPRLRQKRDAPHAALPNTPASAYFDAIDDHEHALLTSREEMHIGGPRKAKERLRLVQPDLSPALSSDDISGDEAALEVNAASSLSFSSDADTPGPITPATPAWKPKELRLVKMSSDSPSDRLDMGRPFAGLGLRSPFLPATDQVSARSRSAAPGNARDVLPIGKNAPANSSPNFPTGSRKKELRLACSTGPPSVSRGKNFGRASSPLPPSSTHSAKSIVPILPPAPTFSPALSSSSVNSRGRFPSHDSAALDAVLSQAKDVADNLMYMTAVEEAKALPTSLSPRLGHLDGGKRKEAPSPLVLADSSKSSYSATDDGDTSTKEGSITTAHQHHTTGSTSDRFLRVATHSSESIPITPMSASTTAYVFHTPLQSPAGAQRAPQGNGEMTNSPDDNVLHCVLRDATLQITKDDSPHSQDEHDDIPPSSTVDAFEYETSCSLSQSVSRASELSSTDREGRIIAEANRPDSVLEISNERPPSPLPEIAFDTTIFTSPRVQRRHSLIEDSLQVAPEVMVKSISDSRAIPTALLAKALGGDASESFHSALPKKQLHPYGAAESQPSRSFYKYEAALDTVHPPLPPKERNASISSTTVRKAAVERPLPPIPKTKTSLVPEVPSFGYTGPISKTLCDLPDFAPAVSPSFTIPYMLQMAEETEHTSRWSSGSDSEEERSTSKARKGSKQQRKSASSASGQTSRKASVSAASSTGSATPRKGAGAFFAGLGLRKKSIPNLSQWGSTTPSPSLVGSWSNPDSPAPGKLDSFTEYPFPPSSSGSSRSYTAGSLAEPLQAVPSSSAGGQDVNRNSQQWKNAALAHAVTAPSSARTSQMSLRKVTTKPSDASIRTTASMGASQGSSSRLHSSATSSTTHSPVLERKPIYMGKEEGTSKDLQGLGIQMPSTQSENSRRELRNSYTALQQSLRITAAKQSTASSEGQTDATQQQRSVAAKQLSSSLSIRPRKQSLPSSTFSNSGKAKKARRRSSLTSPLQSIVASPTESTFASSSGSPDGTPRIAYASLMGRRSHFTAVDEPKLKHQIKRGSFLDDDEGLFAMGQALMSVRNERQTEEKNAVAGMVSKRQGAARPRYNSLTDEGRRWLEEHPDMPFLAARGEILRSNDMSRQCANGGTVIHTTSFASRSESGTDDYGSSDGGAGERGSGSGSNSGSGSSGGADGDEGKDDRSSRRNEKSQVPASLTDEELEVDSDEDSEDGYGGSDVEGDNVPLRREIEARQRTSSTSSDDVPIGRRVRDPSKLQRQLREMDSTGRRRNRVRLSKPAPLQVKATAMKAQELPSSKLYYDLDANDLSARLQKIKETREASEDSCHISNSLARIASQSASADKSGQGEGQNLKSASQRAATSSQTAAVLPPPLPAPSQLAKGIAPHRIQTSNLMGAAQQKSSPLSAGAVRGTQAVISGNVPSDSMDSSTVAMQENYSSQDQHHRLQQEDYRSAVVADFANSIKARSRSRSFAQPFSPPIDLGRAPPLPSRPANGAVPTEESVSRREPPPSSAPASQVQQTMTVTEGQCSPLAKADDEALSPFSLVQHRVYLLNKQRVGTAEVALTARVRDVVHSIMEREPMPADSRIGGWVLYDVCFRLGIERPLREYEVLSDVISLRTNAQGDYLLLKRTELAPYLSIKNVPNSSANLAGWIYVQDNHRRKWNKRWLELRDNCLFLARSEKGKDEVLLCSLSSFDLYLCDADRIKTPKPHSFAMRSQNPIDMFESPEADYVHYLCLSDAAAARHWITAIINARTFVLRQEKSQLFRLLPPTLSVATAASSNAAAPSSSSTVRPDTADIFPAMPRSARQKRVPLHTASPSLNVPSMLQNPSSAPAAPLISFQQHTFPNKGSLMDERFTPAHVQQQDKLPVGGNTPHSIHLREMALDKQRRQELQSAERKGRKEGKPLIGIIPDVPLRSAAGGHRL